MLNKKFLEKLRKDFAQDLELGNDEAALENLRVKFVGRKQGLLTGAITQIPKLTLKDKRELAPKLIDLKKEIEVQLEKKLLHLKKQPSKDKEAARPATDWKIDPSLKLNKPKAGHPHPTKLIIEEIKDIFHYFGFLSQDGPEVELDSYNFQKLRLHKDHPARDTQQTYYLSEEILLRTQTSTMQVRYMESHKPPIRMLFPGRVYRREAIDATHLPAFYQIEGLLIDQQTTMTDLIGIIEFFAKKMFGKGSRIRVYGHHFPYTEPSIEVEVKFGSRWLEIMGAGMVHPEVLKNCKIDPKKYRGWAFGMGPERIAMIKYGIEDIRLFYSNDLKFLEQF